MFWHIISLEGDSQLLIGYARISTGEQNIDLQIDALEKAGCGKIFQEAASSIKTDRKALAEAFSYAREGDTLVVWRLDRLGRSLGRLIELMNELKSRNIGFRSLIDTIDTTTTTGQFFFHITGAFAELERNLIRERTKAGLEAARSRGRKGGRPRSIDEEGLAIAAQLHQNNKNSVDSIAKRLGFSKRTLYRYLQRHRAKRLSETEISDSSSLCPLALKGNADADIHTEA